MYALVLYLQSCSLVYTCYLNLGACINVIFQKVCMNTILVCAVTPFQKVCTDNSIPR